MGSISTEMGILLNEKWELLVMGVVNKSLRHRRNVKRQKLLLSFSTLPLFPILPLNHFDLIPLFPEERAYQFRRMLHPIFDVGNIVVLIDIQTGDKRHRSNKEIIIGHSTQFNYERNNVGAFRSVKLLLATNNGGFRLDILTTTILNQSPVKLFEAVQFLLEGAAGSASPASSRSVRSQ